MYTTAGNEADVLHEAVTLMPAVIDWHETEAAYLAHVIPVHVHNRWYSAIALGTANAILGTVRRLLLWASKCSHHTIEGIDDVLNCNLTYGLVDSMEARNLTRKYQSDEVCFRICACYRCYNLNHICWDMVVCINMASISFAHLCIYDKFLFH